MKYQSPFLGLALAMCLGLSTFGVVREARADIWGTTAFTERWTTAEIMSSSKQGSVWDIVEAFLHAYNAIVKIVASLPEGNVGGVVFGAIELEQAASRLDQGYQWAGDTKTVFIDRGAGSPYQLQFHIWSNDDPLFEIVWEGFGNVAGTSFSYSGHDHDRRGTLTIDPARMPSGIYVGAFTAKETSCPFDCFGIRHQIVLVVNCNVNQCNQTPDAQDAWRRELAEVEAELAGLGTAVDDWYECIATCNDGGDHKAFYDTCCDDRFPGVRAAVEYQLDLQIGKAGRIPPPGFDCCRKSTFDRKSVVAESTTSAPALAVHGGRLHLAWRGTDNRINLLSSADGINFGNKVTMQEWTPASPALVSYQNRLYLAWIGTDWRLNVASAADGRRWDRKVTLPEQSQVAPALAVYGNRLDLYWTGMDGSGHLNRLMSWDGTQFHNKWILDDTSWVAPAATSTGGIYYLAWTGTDGNGALNYWLRPGDPHTVPTVSAARTWVAPGLASDPSHVYLGWTSATGSWVNLGTIVNGRVSCQRTFADWSTTAPGLAYFQGGVRVAWRGGDVNHRINLATLDAFRATCGN